MKKVIKFNWGTGIAISIIIFMVIIIVIATIFMNQRVDLVTDNYYEKTLTYQDQINTYKRTAGLDGKISLKYTDNRLALSFPRSYFQRVNEGQLYFYRPSDSRKDFTVSLQLDENGSQALNTARVEKGYWKVEIKWTMDKKDYLSEHSVLIY
jgi:hypothetical protein